MSIWDELLDNETAVVAWCETCRVWPRRTGQGTDDCRAIVAAADEHMREAGHHVVVEVDQAEGEDGA